MYITYILLLHFNYVWVSPQLYCIVNSFPRAGWLIPSRNLCFSPYTRHGATIQAFCKIFQAFLLHLTFTNLWAHHTPFGVILWWARWVQESPAFWDDRTQAAPRAVLLRETLHTAPVLMFPLLLAKHRFQRWTGNSLYICFSPQKWMNRQWLPYFLKEQHLFFFSKTLMPVLTHQLLATDMYFCLFTTFHVAIRFASVMTFRGSKPNF